MIKTKRVKRACECDECQAVKIGSPPTSILPKTMATASLLAFIIVSKFIDHLSLYRVANVLSRIGINIGRNTLASWVIKLGTELTPLINLLEEQLMDGGYVFCDETKVQVLKEEGKTPQSRSYMWVRARNGPEPIVLFDYDPTRKGKVAEQMFSDFKGFLHTDGYSGYGRVAAYENIWRVACMYHIRRKFKDAYDDAKTNKVSPEKASEFLRFIKKLSKIKNTIEKEDAATRFIVRLKKSKPIMDQMKRWLDAHVDAVRPKSRLGMAINYALGQWPEMMMFLSHGCLEISTNYVENWIRPFALGRRNWLFSNSVDGVQASAKLYSLVQTARANGLEPYSYLKTVFEKLPLAENIDDYEALLPWNIDK